MSWWLSQTGRANSERVAIAELEERSGWLKDVQWRCTNDLHLAADFSIEVDDKEIPLTITYPAFFPDVPPRVVPREAVRLSAHQYGAGGELCLEIRPDNWEPSMTGAMMVESAHGLLAGERPVDGDRPEVANAHRTTVAQDARNQYFRIILSPEFVTQLERLPPVTPIEFELEEIYHASRWIARPSRLGPKDNALWTSSVKPLGPTLRHGFVLRSTSEIKGKAAATYEFLKAVAEAAAWDGLKALLEKSDHEVPILLSWDGGAQLISLYAGEGERKAFDYHTILLPKAQQRLGPEYDALSQKAVAIMGCGSVGSKIATSLARSGVTKFVLVDGDILFPGNLVRNDLDLRSVGLNKPDAVASRIREINPQAEVKVRRVLLGGQESSASTESALKSVGDCDLIVEATADAQIFNLAAAVARVSKKPMIWGEVFAGGVGGLIARIRPDLDPTPHLARKQIAAWCADRGVPWDGKHSVEYDVVQDDAPPLIADDADVSLIAAHMTRMAIDVLAREESFFPQSAYAIGLQKQWIFQAPFDTWPIELEAGGQWGMPASEDNSVELKTLIAELFPKQNEASDAA